MATLEWLWTHNAPMDTHSATLALWAGHKYIFTFLTGESACTLNGQSIIAPKVKWQSYFWIRIASEAGLEGRIYHVHYSRCVGCTMYRYCDDVDIRMDACQFELADGSGWRKVVGFHQYPQDLRIDTQRDPPDSAGEYPEDDEHVPVLWVVPLTISSEDEFSSDMSDESSNEDDSVEDELPAHNG